MGHNNIFPCSPQGRRISQLNPACCMYWQIIPGTECYLINNTTTLQHQPSLQHPYLILSSGLLGEKLLHIF